MKTPSTVYMMADNNLLLLSHDETTFDQFRMPFENFSRHFRSLLFIVSSLSDEFVSLYESCPFSFGFPSVRSVVYPFRMSFHSHYRTLQSLQPFPASLEDNGGDSRLATELILLLSWSLQPALQLAALHQFTHRLELNLSSLGIKLSSSRDEHII